MYKSKSISNLYKNYTKLKKNYCPNLELKIINNWAVFLKRLLQNLNHTSKVIPFSLGQHFHSTALFSCCKLQLICCIDEILVQNCCKVTLRKSFYGPDCKVRHFASFESGDIVSSPLWRDKNRKACVSILQSSIVQKYYQYSRPCTGLFQ